MPKSRPTKHAQAKASKILNVIGNDNAKDRRAPAAYQRTLRAQWVPFACVQCGATGLREQFPGPAAKYCNDECRDLARRAKTRERVRRHREGMRKGGA